MDARWRKPNGSLFRLRIVLQRRCCQKGKRALTSLPNDHLREWFAFDLDRFEFVVLFVSHRLDDLADQAFIKQALQEKSFAILVGRLFDDGRLVVFEPGKQLYLLYCW